MSNTYVPNHAIPPGETLKEAMKLLHITAQDLEALLQRTSDEVWDILEGVTPIKKDLAAKLDLHLRIPQHLILRLEKNYREALKRLADSDPLP